MIKEFSNLEKILLILTFIGGSLILFVPIPYLFIALISVIVVVYLLFNPKVSFYVFIFTLPFTDRIRVLPISFSPNDIALSICIISILIDLFKMNFKIGIKTSIDKWNFIIFILYLFAGITSLSPTGILTTFKFLEAIFAFYIIIYLIRTKLIRISNVIKVLIFTGLIQALIGILQSITGQFGAGFQSQRGILGYFGIGSTTVWHAWGTFGGNGMLPEFLILISLFIIPFYKQINKNSKNKLTLSIYLLALYMGYSKESFLVLIVCLIIYYNLTAKNPKDAILKTSFISIAVLVFGLILMSTPYADTVNETLQGRFAIWKYPIYALTHNARFFFLGSGLNAYWEMIDPLLEPYIFNAAHFTMLAHNYYILAIQEFGIIGAGLLFAFFISMFKKFTKGSRKYVGYYSKFNIIGAMFISTIFTTSFFGQFYYSPFARVLMYIFLATILAKEPSFERIKRKCSNV